MSSAVLCLVSSVVWVRNEDIFESDEGQVDGHGSLDLAETNTSLLKRIHYRQLFSWGTCLL